MKKQRRLIRELVRIVGRCGVVTDPAGLRVYEADGLTVFSAAPDVVVFPQTADQVAQIVEVCRREGVPFVARGAGTGLSGGALPLAGGVLIALNRMDRIVEIDIPNLRAVVEPGLINQDLSQALTPHGYYYAPDPASQTACTIGGNVAENSGGPRTPKYGVTTHHVLGLEVVLPEGEVAFFGGKVPDMPGYDFVGLMVGSEGTLGIVTKVIVRILRKPEAVCTLLAVFETVEDASHAVSAIVARGILPVAIEMMDRLSIQAVEQGVGAGYPLDAGAVLLIELDGPRAEVEALIEPVLEVCRTWHAREVRVARDEEERLRLWKGRKAAFASMGRLSPDYYVQDAVIPRTRLPDIMKRIEELSHRYGLRVANVFHAGDGNLHPLILFDAQRPGELQRAEALGAEILRACVEAGGSLTGEHGVGLEKRDYMPLMFTEADLRAMQKVKRAFDPEGLLNPGKVFPRDYVPPWDPARIPRTGPSVEELLRRLAIVDRLADHLGRVIAREHVGGRLEAGRYAVDGHNPSGVAWPRTVEDISALLAFAAEHDLKVIPWGNGTMQSLGRIPDGADLIIDLSEWTGVVDYEPADMTVTFRTGTLLSEAQSLLATHGQFIPLDPPFAEQATLGGILATAASGPLRHRYGTPRDLVLAVRVVHPDGSITRGGAKVVKNVAGYDMPKLYVGSLGTLGIIVEATLRVYPRPAAEATCLLTFDTLTSLQAALARILDAPLVPTAVEFLDPTALQVIAERTGLPGGGQYALAVAFGSPCAPAVTAQTAQTHAIGREEGARSASDWTGELHTRFWAVLRDFRLTQRDVVLKVGVPICQVGPAVRSVEEIARRTGLRTAVIGEAGVGILRVYIANEATEDEAFLTGVTDLVKSLRRWAVSAGGYLIVLAAPTVLKKWVDVWGPVSDPVLRLMHRLKYLFDPRRTLNPGRFVEGI